MFCANCRNTIADGSRFCPKCGTRLNRTNHTETSVVPPPRGKPWEKVFWIDLYRDNKPGFYIIAAMVLAMLGAFGYLVYSRMQGGVVVTVEKISKAEHLDLETKITLQLYCREFGQECAQKGRQQIENDIRAVLPSILVPRKSMDAKRIYRNNSESIITINQFLYRNAPGPWQAAVRNPAFFEKARRLQLEIRMVNSNVPFVTKVDFASTLALLESNNPLQPGEERIWSIGYNDGSEFQVEYSQDGKIYKTPVLRVR